MPRMLPILNDIVLWLKHVSETDTATHDNHQSFDWLVQFALASFS